MHPERENKRFDHIQYWDKFVTNNGVIATVTEIQKTEADFKSFEADMTKIAEKNNLKVFFEEHFNKKTLDVYFIDKFHLQKTLYVLVDFNHFNLDHDPIMAIERKVREHFTRVNVHFDNKVIADYVKNDIESTKSILNELKKAAYCFDRNKEKETMKIKDVRFNGPATIVFWKDGTKTIVKCGEGDAFDPEKGIAMAIAKKALGNKHDYYDVIDKYTKRYYKELKRNEKKETENG